MPVSHAARYVRAAVRGAGVDAAAGLTHEARPRDGGRVQRHARLGEQQEALVGGAPQCSAQQPPLRLCLRSEFQ